jgi:outer membrane immunogenic protein
MKRLFLAVSILALSAVGASAADLAVRPYTKAPLIAPVVWSWTGFYLGGEVGGKWERDRWTAISLADNNLGGVRAPIDASSPRTYETSSFRGGIYGGYNWQISQFVIGVEADGAWADATKTAAGFPGCTLAGCTIGFTFPPNGLVAGGDLTSVNMRWDASLRGRLGILASPDLLIYGTGGIAWQNVRVNGICGPAANSFQCNTPQPVPSAVTVEKTLPGWTVGVGAEWHAWGNWLLRGEYRFADFGTSSYVFPIGTSNTNNTYRFNMRTETQIATFGVAYKF